MAQRRIEINSPNPAAPGNQVDPTAHARRCDLPGMVTNLAVGKQARTPFGTGASLPRRAHKASLCAASSLPLAFAC
jgi:hypothetical protein